MTLHPVTELYADDNDHLRESICSLISRPGQEAVAGAEAARASNAQAAAS